MIKQDTHIQVHNGPNNGQALVQSAHHPSCLPLQMLIAIAQISISYCTVLISAPLMPLHEAS